MPDDADVDVHREWLLIRLRSDVDGRRRDLSGRLRCSPPTSTRSWPASATSTRAVRAGRAHVAAATTTWTRHHLILTLLRDVREPAGGADARGTTAGARAPLAGVPALGQRRRRRHRPGRQRRVPARLQRLHSSRPRCGYGVVGWRRRRPMLKQRAGVLRRRRAARSRQHFATSADGTRVPYFVVGRPDAPAGPTLLTGVRRLRGLPHARYSGVIGRGWLARGGTYVVANIRGGGEYGPHWHQAGAAGEPAARLRGLRRRRRATWSTAASPRRRSWASRAAATAGC